LPSGRRGDTNLHGVKKNSPIVKAGRRMCQQVPNWKGMTIIAISLPPE
jgi:hypothetical protein